MEKYLQIVLWIRSQLGSKIFPRWEKEPVPDSAILFRSIHFSLVNPSTKKPSSSCFNDYELSCDWDAYSTPDASKNLIGQQYKPPHNLKVFKKKEDYYIANLPVNIIKTLFPNQENIKHDPTQYFPRMRGFPNNRSHTIVIGDKDQKIRVKNRKLLSKKSEWALFKEVEWEAKFEEHKKKLANKVQ